MVDNQGWPRTHPQQFSPDRQPFIHPPGASARDQPHAPPRDSKPSISLSWLPKLVVPLVLITAVVGVFILMAGWINGGGAGVFDNNTLLLMTFAMVLLSLVAVAKFLSRQR